MEQVCEQPNGTQSDTCIMKTKFTLLVTVLISIQFGVLRAAPNAQKKPKDSRPFEINLIRIDYYEHVTIAADGKKYPFAVREIYKTDGTALNDIVVSSYYPDDDLLRIRRLGDSYWGFDKDAGLLVRQWTGSPNFKYKVKRVFLRLSDGAKSKVADFTIDVKKAKKISVPPVPLKNIKSGLK